MMKRWYLFVLGLIVIFIVVKNCEDEPEVIVETKTEYVKITDTITNVIIREVPRKVYVQKIRTVKGKDSIIYRDKPSDSTFTANQYSTKLESNNATANLEITTTGELLDVSGTIDYTQTNTITEITKIKPKSGLFMYGESSISPVFERAEIGLDYQIRNKVIIGGSLSYNNVVQKTYANIKIGFRIF